MLTATWFVLAGMAIVFATLSVLVLVMMALNRWLVPPARVAGAGADAHAKPRRARASTARHA